MAAGDPWRRRGMTEARALSARFSLFGASARLGWAAAFLTLAVDQAFKWWMLGPYDLARRGVVEVTSFFDLVLVWNRGVSYGWFTQSDDQGRWLLIGVSLVVVAAMVVWLAKSRRHLANLALGLIIGGALGNVIDRVVHGAVADFFSFHAFGYSWYVFNLADVAIVVGVALLILDSWREGRTG